MGVTKIEYIPVSKLSEQDKKKYNIKPEDKFAQIRVTNPNEGMKVIGVKSAIDEVRKSFKKKELENFKL